MNRAYSLLEIRQVDDDARTITGIASTPTPDRMGDVVKPDGAVFKLPIPLLWQHNSSNPIGNVTKAKVTKNGIEVVAEIAKGVSEEIDRAWSLIKAGLVRGLSIGFRALEQTPIPNSWGVTFDKWEWLELSAVTIPANADASIQTIKSLDSALLAALGKTQEEAQRPALPGASGTHATPKPKERKPMAVKQTVAEQISAFEATRAAKAAEMVAIQEKAAGEGRTKDAAEREGFETLRDEIENIDRELADLRVLEKTNKAAAKPVEAKDEKSASESRAHSVRVDVRNTLPKGTLFTRYAMAVAAGKGSVSDALAYAKRWDGQTPEVSAYIKAVAGTSGGGTGESASGEWGAELVYPTNLASEFIELLRPATVVGRLNGIRRVPFNVRIPTQVSGSTVNWVGEGAAKPVSELSFGTVTLTYHKIAGIVVLTDELVRHSSPSAEEAVRRDLIEQIAQFMDGQFLNTTITASASRPASVTNGVTPVTATGTDADSFYFDMNTALAAFDNAEMSDASIHLVMPRALARGISGLRNNLGQFEFGSMSAAGGTLMGYPVIVSNSAPANTIVIISASDILMADDGSVMLDASREATLDMAGGDTPAFSLWQKNCVGIRAERSMDWVKRRSTAVAMIGTASYGPQSEEASA